MTTQPISSVPPATLSANGRKARYGVAYMRSVCAQAGVGMSETPADEDVLAVDCDVSFAEASVRVQVKCTSRFKISGSSASWAVEDSWVKAWSQSQVPVYFVLVIVGDDASDWLDHPEDGTFHRTAAFWCRLRGAELGSRIDVPKSQRLTAATLGQWHHDLLALFRPGGA